MDWRDEIDPELRAVIQVGGPRIGDLTVDELGPLYAERRWSPEYPGDDDVNVSDVGVDRALEVRLVQPVGPSRRRPAIYAIHGGGFIVGSSRMDTPTYARWARRHGCVVVAVDYRLAPEHPYPAAIDDCEAGLRWTIQHATDLGIDTSRIGVAGTSAGGALALSLALRWRHATGPPLLFVAADAPALDDRLATPSSQWQVPVADRATIALGWRAYLGEAAGTPDVSGDAAPARAEIVSGLPSVFLTVGALDILHDEIVAFARRLEQDRVPVDLRVYPGAQHTFASLAPRTELAERFRQDQDDWMSRRFRSR